MESDLLPFVRTNLRAVGKDVWPAISEATGVPCNTLRKLAYNDRKNPRLSTIEPVAKWFKEREPE